MAPIFGVQEETVPVDNRDQKEPLNFSINNFYIPGLKGISTVKSNTDENLAPFASQNYSPINQKHSKSFYGGDESWGPYSTDHENWSPGSYSPWRIGTLKYLEIKIEEWPNRAKWGQSGPNGAK